MADDDISEAPEPLNAAVHRYWRRLGSSDIALKLISRGLRDGRFLGLQDGEPVPKSHWRQARLEIELVGHSFCAVVMRGGAIEKGAFQICRGRESSSSESLGPASFGQKPLPEPTSREQKRILELTNEAYPNGWLYVRTSDIMKSVGDEIEAQGMKAPKRDVFLRALGRRD